MGTQDGIAQRVAFFAGSKAFFHNLFFRREGRLQFYFSGKKSYFFRG
jgi:hypothetical protein